MRTLFLDYLFLVKISDCPFNVEGYEIKASRGRDKYDGGLIGSV